MNSFFHPIANLKFTPSDLIHYTLALRNSELLIGKTYFWRTQWTIGNYLNWFGILAAKLFT